MLKALLCTDNNNAQTYLGKMVAINNDRKATVEEWMGKIRAAIDTQEKLSAMTCLPDSLQGKRYYQPTEQGNEGRYKQRLEEIIRWKEEHRGK